MSLIHLSDDNFEQEVLKAKGKVLVDFWATWCGPCQMLGPVIEEMSNEIDDVKFCKVDVDDCRNLALKYKIMSIPTIIVFENGEIDKKSVGLISKNEILDLIGK